MYCLSPTLQDSTAPLQDLKTNHITTKGPTGGSVMVYPRIH